MNSENVANAAKAAGLTITARHADGQVDQKLGPNGGAHRVERIIRREDGTEVRIVAQNFFGGGLTRSVDVYVHRRESPDQQWILTSNRPHPDWREMSVDEYVKHGRSEMLRTVSWGEILKVSSKLASS